VVVGIKWVVTGFVTLRILYSLEFTHKSPGRFPSQGFLSAKIGAGDGRRHWHTSKSQD
jgi:hypothetical protein